MINKLSLLIIFLTQYIDSTPSICKYSQKKFDELQNLEWIERGKNLKKINILNNLRAIMKFDNYLEDVRGIDKQLKFMYAFRDFPDFVNLETHECYWHTREDKIEVVVEVGDVMANLKDSIDKVLQKNMDQRLAIFWSLDIFLQILFSI